MNHGLPFPDHPKADPFTTVWKSAGARSKNSESPPTYHIDPVCPQLLSSKRLILKTRLGSMIAGGRKPCKVCGHKPTTEALRFQVELARARAYARLEGVA